MAELVKNVYVAEQWWGPAHARTTPPGEVAALITNPSCWDSPPDEVHDLPPVPPTEGERTAASGTEDPASPMVSTGAAGSGDDGGGPQPPPEPDPEPSIDLDALDKPALLALARERGHQVDGRTGEKRLRAMLSGEG